MTGEALAYIRRSVSRVGDSGDLSREFQTAEVLRLANGDAPRVIDSDWGRSAATDKTHRRLAFLAVMEAVERGEVSTLYAYSADRLARSVEWSSRLWNACARNATAIVTTTRRFEPFAADDAGWSIWHYEALSNEQALRGMTAKARATAARRKARGDYIGQVPYGYRRVRVEGSVRLERDPERPVGPIIDIVRESGGRIRTAVRRLNEAGIRSAYGKSWDRMALVRLVEREAPELRPPKAPSGRREAPGPGTPVALAKLLRCHCGATLTPNRHVERRTGREGTRPAVSYYCHRGNADPASHGRPYYVSEAALMPWIETEAGRLRLGIDAVKLADDAADRMTAVDEDLRRAGVVYRNRGMTDDEYQLEVRRLEAERDRLVDLGRATPVPPRVDFTWPPEALNIALRSLWRWVELGSDLRPIRAEWRVSAEYLAD